MQDKGRSSGGKTVGHVFAFIGITLLLIVIAAGAALFIATKGPSETAREAVYDWAAERNLAGVAGIFLSDAEKAALTGDTTPDGEETPEETEQPMIIIPSEAPDTAGDDADGEETAEPAETEQATEQPEGTDLPEETGSGEEAA